VEIIRKQYQKTLNYFRQNSFEISREELKYKMIGEKYFNDQEIDKVNRLEKIENKYFLDKLEKARELANELKHFNEIVMIGITGSVASEHPDKNDDIDLMIVTKNNCLWKTRLKLKWWLMRNKINHRRKNKKEIKDDYCFNLWLEESYLEIPQTKQNIRNGLDLIMVKVLVDKNSYYQKMLKDNLWANKIVTNGYQRLIKKTKFEKTKNRFDLVNFGCFLAQFVYMLPTKSKELVSLHQAFFHP